SAHPLSRAEPVPKSPTDSDLESTRSKLDSKPISKFAVRLDGDREQGIAFDDLSDAVRTAMGSHGWVELRTSCRLASDKFLDFRTGRGALRLRAAAGTTPVIEIDLKGGKPLITTGSAGSLDISGGTILAHYAQAAAGGATAPPAVIRAAGGVKIDRCAFILDGGLRLSDSRAISSNGGRLEVDRCWFEGFDKAIELYAVDRTPTRISQTMFVPTGGQAPELSGWGVKIQSLRRKQPQPHLILEHCTFEGAGLLDLVDNERSTDPLQVVVKDCFVRATALMACKRDTRTPKQVQDQVTWQGTENWFEILGRDWIVLSAN